MFMICTKSDAIGCNLALTATMPLDRYVKSDTIGGAWADSGAGVLATQAYQTHSQMVGHTLFFCLEP